MLGILIGEAIYNLRAALDYLIYELAFFDSGSIQKGTQFPIEDTEKRWNIAAYGSSKRRPLLEGLNKGHKTAIKGLQPCCGCEWTGTLRRISNPDKHRTLTVVRPQKGIWFGETMGGTPHVLSTSSESVDVDIEVTFQVQFDDGTPVIETLEVLHSKVTSVLDSFKPELSNL